ncbi:D-alanine--D-alanine ligase [Geranomyces variabilis]|nr:D-alanine--D-alanine ligase [Geranomyces variabilis]KAJ3134595.1 hypothetical protein HDU90_004927 [Geranomyces variabilis]
MPVMPEIGMLDEPRLQNTHVSPPHILASMPLEQPPCKDSRGPSIPLPVLPPDQHAPLQNNLVPQAAKKTHPLHVAVLMGGWSRERCVSLCSGEAVSVALEQLGHRVTRIDMTRNVAAVLVATKPDVVFNALHGGEGENGAIQGVLDILGVPYTHSGVRASVIAIDKALTKKVLALEGIPMPEGCIVCSEDLYIRDPLPRPYVLKPLNEGSSIGVTVVKAGGRLPEPIARESLGPWTQFESLLAEPYIPGRELTVGVLDDRALLVTESVPKNHSPVFDFEAKYTVGATDRQCPAHLPPEIAAACCDWAERAHKALECSGATRMDFRWNEEQGLAGLYLLEVNTQPGLTPTSLFPEQAAAIGLDYGACLQAMLDSALKKPPLIGPPSSS